MFNRVNQIRTIVQSATRGSSNRLGLDKLIIGPKPCPRPNPGPNPRPKPIFRPSNPRPIFASNLGSNLGFRNLGAIGVSRGIRSPLVMGSPYVVPCIGGSPLMTQHVRWFSDSSDRNNKSDPYNNRHVSLNGSLDDSKSLNSSKDPFHSVSTFDQDEKHDGLSPLQRYSRKVGMTTGKFLGLTAITGGSTIGAGFALMSAGVPMDTLMTMGAVGWIGSAIGSFYHAYQLDKDGKTEEQRLRHAYWMQGLMGVTISPSLLMFHQFIPHALITTGALVAGPITAARMMPDGAMLKWGPALYTGLWGLLGVGVTSIFAPMLGFHGLGMALHNIDLYGGVALFTIYNAYDTHVMIENFKRGNRDYVGHAAHYSLNAVNIFIRLLEIFAKTQQRK